jgi:hypothetical protein
MLILMLLFFATQVQQPSPHETNDLGGVRGTVVDQNGNPIEGARVYVVGDNDPPMSHPTVASTNAHGEFVLDQILARRVKVHAYKESDYYADVKFAFNIPTKWDVPEVEVKPGQTVTGVVVRLGQRAAKLHLYVRDAVTKELVHGIYFKLCREDHPTYCLAGSGPPDIERFVPSDMGISINVSADSHGQSDYQWQYRDPKSGSVYLKAKSGETKSMDILISVPRN